MSVRDPLKTHTSAQRRAASYTSASSLVELFFVGMCLVACGLRGTPKAKAGFEHLVAVAAVRFLR